MTACFANEAEESAYAKRMLARADKTLALIDEAFIVKERGHTFRAMPTFRHEEISLGATLGTGGFGIVNEITKFTLDEDDDNKEVVVVDENHAVEKENCEKENVATAGLVKSNVDTGGAVSSSCNGGLDKATTTDLTAATSDTAAEGNEAQDVTAATPATTSSSTVVNDTDLLLLQNSYNNQDDEFHYDIAKARGLMSLRVLKNGSTARYALKRLHNDLTELERARGMIDLAVEAKYLSLVWHPNIIKMRGMCRGPLVSDDFFIILDRLYETLDKRLHKWQLRHQKLHTCWKTMLLFCSQQRKQAIADLMVERMMVAYDLAAAFFYLHENRIVYRDIKPENIGFDLRGDVKVFDFGLCKSLNPKAKARATEENGNAYGYRLTGRAGSIPYMAPEVAKMETYDTKCDVFSFAILLWEMLSLRGAYHGYSSKEFMEKVVLESERLPVCKSWPPLTRLMIPEAWDVDPRKRPDMKRVAILIRGDLNDMTNDDRVLHRTRHLQNRSQHSIAEFSLGSEPFPPCNHNHEGRSITVDELKKDL